VARLSGNPQYDGEQGKKYGIECCNVQVAMPA
jgi:hypothetical protein